MKYGGTRPFRTYCIAGTLFCIHWVTSGRTRSRRPTPTATACPNYVEYVITTMKYVYASEVAPMGYRKPLYDTATAGRYRGNPNGKYDIYLAELGNAGLYGYCAPEGSTRPHQSPGYCVLDNNYAPAQYGDRNFFNPLRVTAAHEFFHAIQFGYDVDEDCGSWRARPPGSRTRSSTPSTTTTSTSPTARSATRAARSTTRRTSTSTAPGSSSATPRSPWATRRRTPDAGTPPTPPGSRVLPAGHRLHGLARTTGTTSSSLRAVEPAPDRHATAERAGYPVPVYLSHVAQRQPAPSTGWVRTNLFHHLPSSSIRVAPDSRPASTTQQLPDQGEHPGHLREVGPR